VKKNHQIPRIINQKIAQKLIEKISMTDIAHQLSISTSTVIRKLNDFHFKHDFSCLPEIMSWDVETVRVVTVSLPNAKIVLERFHIVQHLSRAMS
ncbi:helix-turn-helix domain-containing protein, partial [Streptococcus pneumoniae]|nr:helix-turn-helix domain-containing protein [Streptococcus pneumoniae]